MAQNTLTGTMNTKGSYLPGGDEWYTPLDLIARELDSYPLSTWQGRTVHCPCDDPDRSQFVRYFKENFSRLGLKALYATSIHPLVTRIDPSCQYDIDTLDKPGKAFYMDAAGERSYSLDGTGDFLSVEVTGIMHKADIIVTNPPFTLFRRIVRHAFMLGKAFIFLGTATLYTPSLVDFVLSNKLAFHPGYTCGSFKFARPDGSAMPLGNGMFYTNIPIDTTYPVRRMTPLRPFSQALEAGAKYTIAHHNVFGTLLECSKIADIPSDYAGPIAVPLTVQTRLHASDYTIIGYADRCLDCTFNYMRLVIRLNNPSLPLCQDIKLENPEA